MVNANSNSPASNRKKYMDVFGGKKTQLNNDFASFTSSPTVTASTTPSENKNFKPTLISSQNLEEKINQKKAEPRITNTDSIKKQKKIFGLDARSVIAVTSIALFFVLSMAGVLIALQQRMNPEEVALPNTPKSQPAAAEIIDPPSNTACTLAFTIAEPTEYDCNSDCETSEQCQTADESYICSTEYDNKCRLADNESAVDCLPETSPSPTPTPTPSVTPTPSPTPTPTPSPTPTPPTYACNSDCDSNAVCESVNANYICSTSYGDKCRLDSNPASETCEPEEETYTCNSDCTTNEQCQTASSSYICYQNNCRLDSNPSASNCQPTTYTPPVIGCNDACTENADCTNSEHICYNNACRLADNPTSSTCSIAQVVNQTTNYQTTKGGQPALPEALPESGSNAILDWFKAGLGVMGIGAVLLLLL